MYWQNYHVSLELFKYCPKGTKNYGYSSIKMMLLTGKTLEQVCGFPVSQTAEQKKVMMDSLRKWRETNENNW